MRQSVMKYLCCFSLFMLLNACTVQRMVHKRGFNLGIGAALAGQEQTPKAFSVKVLRPVFTKPVQDTSSLKPENTSANKALNKQTTQVSHGTKQPLRDAVIQTGPLSSRKFQTGEMTLKGYSSTVYARDLATETDSLSGKEPKKSVSKGKALAMLTGGMALGALAVLLFFSAAAAEMLWLLFLLSLLSLVLLFEAKEHADAHKPWFQLLVKLFAYPAIVISGSLFLISALLLAIQKASE